MARSFLLGILATLLVLGLACILVITQGWMGTSAQTKASGFERWAARTALRASIARGTAALQDPVPESDASLSAGVKLYAQNCAVCHGAADEKPSLLAQGFYIKAPMLAKHGVEDDPEQETYWKIAHGIRFSAMPAFETRLNDTQMWQLTQFLKRMDQLPPAVEAQWKQVPSAGATAAPG